MIALIWISFILIMGALIFVYYKGMRKHQKDQKNDEFNVRPKDEYEIEFKISFPLKDGGYRETSTMKINVTAESPQQAKKKLITHVMSKVQVTVTSHKRIV